MKTKQDKRTTETKDKKKERKKNKKQLSLFVKRDERSGGSYPITALTALAYRAPRDTTSAVLRVT